MQKKVNIKILFIVVAFIFSISAVFAYSYLAQNVGYSPTDTDWNVDNTKDALDQLRDKFGRESKLITGIDFTAVPANRTMLINVSTTTSSNTEITGYHVYLTDSSNNIKSFVSSSNVINATGLDVNTSYYVYVVAYDKFDKYKESTTRLVSTLLNPEKLVPTLTSNTSGGGVAFATYTGNGRSAWEAFDGVISPSTAYGSRPGYMVAGSGTNQIGYDFGAGNEKIVSRFVYYGHPGDANCRYKSITLQYSDNGSTWVDVQTFTPANPTSYSNVSDLAETFEITEAEDYHRYWRIHGVNTGYGWSGLLELEFWGY